MLVLSGGAGSGDFEVGALLFLYEAGIYPDYIYSTSVGSVNAIKIAEGESADKTKGLAGLQQMWLNAVSSDYFYTEAPNFQNLDGDVKDGIMSMLGRGGGSGGGGISPVSLPSYAWIMLNVPGLSNFVASTALNKINEVINWLNNNPNIFTLRPLEKLLYDTSILDTTLVKTSTIKLRLGVCSLKTGNIRFITNDGTFLDDTTHSEKPVDPIQAVLASAGIPCIFEPRLLNDQYYVDGGTREVLPLPSALRELGGVDHVQIYAIQATVPGVSEKDAFTSTAAKPPGILDIAGRASLDILVDNSVRDAMNPPLGQPSQVVALIYPTISVHDSFSLDPGRVRINIDYGYLCASDIVFTKDRQKSSDDIINFRLNIWYNEELILHNAAAFPPLGKALDANTVNYLTTIKLQLRDMIKNRWLTVPPPPGVERWWSDFEKHNVSFNFEFWLGGEYDMNYTPTDADGNPTGDQITQQFVFPKSQPPPGVLLRDKTTLVIYVIYGGAKFAIPDMPTFANMQYSIPDAVNLDSAIINKVPTIPVDGTLLKEFGSDKVYVVQNQQLCFIPSMDVFGAHGFKVSYICVVPAGTLVNIPSGPNLA